MNYAPIPGLRLLAVETGMLAVAFVAAWWLLRFVIPNVKVPRWLNWVLAKNWRSVVLVILAALVGRALLIWFIPIPEPRINDEYSYLLMADTFAHHRLTSPTPPAWQHFETFHVNLLPTYHSKYGVAPGVALAFGQMLFHEPWVGTYLATALMCGAICWALQALASPGFALLGGLLAVVRLALLSYWMNSYYGGSVAALGGALALGAVMRLLDDDCHRRSHVFLAATFALALLMLATSRPYEGTAYATPLLGCFAWQVFCRKKLLLTTALPFAIVVGFGAFSLGYYNLVTTGNALLLPHLLNERTYSPLPLFLAAQPKTDFVFRDPAFARFYQLTTQEYEYEATRSLWGLFQIEAQRLLRNWFFYIGPALTFPVMLGLLVIVRQRRFRIALFALLSTVVALGLCTYSLPHYAAPATVVLCLFGVAGLQYLWTSQSHCERAFVAAVCLTVVTTSMTRQTGATAVNSAFAFPDSRKAISQRLEGMPGKHLLLVSYDFERHYPGNELVHNGADLGSQRILWARSKGAANDRDLCRAYPDRTFWDLIANDQSTSLTPSNLCRQ